MNPERDRDREFEQNMSQFILLLKKIMKNLPGQNGFQQALSGMKDSGLNLNICFFSLFPMSGEEMDAMEEIYDHYLSHQEERYAGEDLTTELNASDIEFLRRNGISF